MNLNYLWKKKKKRIGDFVKKLVPFIDKLFIFRLIYFIIKYLSKFSLNIIILNLLSYLLNLN